MGRSNYSTRDFESFTDNSHMVYRVHHDQHRLLPCYTKASRETFNRSWSGDPVCSGDSPGPGYLLLSILFGLFTPSLLLPQRSSLLFVHMSMGSSTSEGEHSSQHHGLKGKGNLQPWLHPEHQSLRTCRTLGRWVDFFLCSIIPPAKV